MAMDRIEKTIEVDLPVETVYRQWTDFASFPEFMEGIKRVDRLGANRMRWHAEIGGKDKAWEAEVTQQKPNRMVAWRSTSGAPNNGSVTFEDLGERTRVRLLLEYEPEGAYEQIGSKIGAVSARVGGDLERFKGFVESREIETFKRTKRTTASRRTGLAATSRRKTGRTISRKQTTTSRRKTGRTISRKTRKR